MPERVEGTPCTPVYHAADVIVHANPGHGIGVHPMHRPTSESHLSWYRRGDMISDLNYWSILVSGLLYFILGGLWYAVVFSKPYQAAVNFTEEQWKQAGKDFPKALIAHLISGLITAYILVHIVRFFGAEDFARGMESGFWMWLGFVLTIKINDLMFTKTHKYLFLIDIGFYLVVYTLMGGLLTVWR
jgi:hypothetical protein